jgi:hypothetical protein
LCNPASPIATAHEPDRIKIWVIGKAYNSLKPFDIGSREMSRLGKALVMKNQFGRRVGVGGKRRNTRRVFEGERGGRRANSDTHILLFPSFLPQLWLGAIAPVGLSG